MTEANSTNRIGRGDDSSIYYKGISREEIQTINQRKQTLYDAMRMNDVHIGTSREHDFFVVQPIGGMDKTPQKELWNSRAEYMYARHGKIIKEFDPIDQFLVVRESRNSSRNLYNSRMNRARARFNREWNSLDSDQRKMIYLKFYSPQTTVQDVISTYKVFDSIEDTTIPTEQANN